MGDEKENQGSVARPIHNHGSGVGLDETYLSAYAFRCNGDRGKELQGWGLGRWDKANGDGFGDGEGYPKEIPR
jgi:hypothetical protein